MSLSKGSKVLARLEAENPEEKVELVAPADGAPLAIRSLRYGRGIGWYVAKTIPLDSAQAKMLMNALRASVAAAARKAGKGNVIPYPGSEPRS